jgi:hypothetical protein
VYSIDVLHTVEQVFEVACALGRFHALLQGIPVDLLAEWQRIFTQLRSILSGIKNFSWLPATPRLARHCGVAIVLLAAGPGTCT